MEHIYYPRGVCSREMRVEVEDGIIRRVEVVGGCDGNLKGISKLLVGMRAEDAIERMEGIRCGFIGSSPETHCKIENGRATIDPIAEATAAF